MRRVVSFIISAAFFLSYITPGGVSTAQNEPSNATSVPSFIDFVPAGSWKADKVKSRAPGEDVPEFYTSSSRTFFVHIPNLPKSVTSISYGGALNLKYFSGISYDYLRKNIPGKTLSFSVTMPKSAVSSFSPIPNRLRVTLKSEKNGEWTEYYPGGHEWTTVRKEGKYDFSIKIPETPTPAPYGTATFYPENLILVSVEYYIMEGDKRLSSVNFSISDLKIDGIDIDPRVPEWQLMTQGRAANNTFLPSFPEGSTLLFSAGNSFNMVYSGSKLPSGGTHVPSEPLKDIFLTLPVYIPDNLRLQKGSIEMTMRGDAGTVRSTVKNFDSCTIEGRVYLTLPLEAFGPKSDIEGLLSRSEITLRLKTRNPHTKDMMPIVIEPLRVRKGGLIPFDNKWRVRDIQGLGGYKKITVGRDPKNSGSGGFNTAGLGRDSYQLTAVTRLKGGIDWTNPYYRVEIVRDLEGAPIDLDNTHLEVIMSPLTDTLVFWQKPFRARLGVIDVNGKFMFGPNVSLSEGLSSVATVDVSSSNPIPKGIQTDGFDPKMIKSIVINIEASHSVTKPMDIKLAFINLLMSPKETPRPNGINKIDFGRQKRDIPSWELTKLTKDNGGYVVGINYPFPVIDVPPEILAVPHIYPPVGMKTNDSKHFGFASEITKTTVIKDLSTMAASDINMVRFFILGHLEGIFTWDEKGLDIKGFSTDKEVALQKAAGMRVEKFAEFLNANEETFFSKTDVGGIAGIEEHVMSDLTALLDILEEVEKKTGKRVYAVLSLYDFLLGDGTTKEGPLRVYTVGEHPGVVTNPLIKVKAEALVWKMMKDLAKDPRFYKYVAIVEIMNEPENATILSTKKDFNDLLNFIGEGIYLAKDAVGPNVPVSVGFRSWAADLRFWAPIGEGVDVLMVHYWESLESYNINVPGMWPLGLPASKIWEYLGSEADGRPMGMGEISPGNDIKKNLFTMERAGYDFSLIWSYSGHDSFDAKPFLRAIRDYQQSSRLLKTLSKLPKEELKKAFLYIITSRALFEEQFPDEVSRENAFRVYLSEKLTALSDPALKKTIENILLIAELKGSLLGRRDIRFILFKLLEER